jgi:hypothetical protein
MSTETIIEQIDDETHPDLMSKSEALEFLQDVSAQLEGRIEALVNEIEESEE